jgi:hypothetical protein
MRLLVEYAGGGTRKAVPTESGRWLHLHVPSEVVRQVIPDLGLIRRNKILLCGRHHDELESLLAAETERQCEPLNREYFATRKFGRPTADT